MTRWANVGMLILVLASSEARGQEGTAKPAGEKRGVMVEGWKGRLDPQAVKQGRTIDDAKFWSSGDELHIEPGPPGFFWNPSLAARGEYTITATFNTTGAAPPRETYGVFMGGSDLEGDVPNYLYCSLYGAGMFSIRHRFGDELHTLVERRASEAIHRPDAQGNSSNTIAWRVDRERVACVINGIAVATFPHAVLIGNGKLASTDGAYGLRINHNLDVRVTGFRVTQQ